MRPVGILGGMGPEATVDLMSRVISAVDARDDSDHVPLIVHQNSQVPSRIAALIEGTGEDPGPVLASMARDLERAGAIALAMPCNTAHHYADQIRAATALPFLDMVDLACTHAASVADSGRFGLLGSPALARARVYDAAAAAHGVEIVHAPDSDAVLALIRQIKREGASHDAEAQLERIARSLLAQDIGAVCVACTEFSLMTNTLRALSVPVFDALDLLVDAIVMASRSEETEALKRQDKAPHGSGRSPVQPNDPTTIGRLN